MIIKLGLNERDISAIREISIISEISFRNLEKEISENCEEWSDEQRDAYNSWFNQLGLMRKLESLIENELEIEKSERKKMNQLGKYIK